MNRPKIDDYIEFEQLSEKGAYNFITDLISYCDRLEKALDKACSELEEYTYMKCEYHCGGCYNENKEECDDVCFFKNLQSAQRWKEHLLKDE